MTDFFSSMTSHVKVRLDDDIISTGQRSAHFYAQNTTNLVKTIKKVLENLGNFPMFNLNEYLKIKHVLKN